jgi:hypothetical protein
MRTKSSLIGICLLATFAVIFGSILSMALFSQGQQPEAVSINAVAKPVGD